VATSDVEWASFCEEHAYVEEEVYAALQETAHLFDLNDGMHAKWSSDGLLGLLLVFDPEEAEQLLAAFYAGMDGVTNAQEAFAVWVGSLMGMLRSCMQGLEP
jgi:hypothetical protein|tara:strand:- start:608 stop:913 length:306 start_codon:yes stop_codon:yes gene_type:complete